MIWVAAFLDFRAGIDGHGRAPLVVAWPGAMDANDAVIVNPDGN